MKLFVLLILAVFASEKNVNDTENNAENEQRIGNNEEVVVKIEQQEYMKVNKRSKCIGVFYDKNKSKWRALRRSKDESKQFSNGSYDDEETAAHASDTLARELMKNGEHGHKLNFPDDHTEVYPEKKRFTSKFIGVSYHEKRSKWFVQRWSKNENKKVSNGYFDDEETAAHASDTFARKLMENGALKLKLNFPDDHTEVYREKKNTASKLIGVLYIKSRSKWSVQRWSKKENKKIYNGFYDDAETAAHASDTLAKKLMENGEQNHKLNFPDDHIEVYREEKSSKYIGVFYDKNKSKWRVQRWIKNENKRVSNGSYDDAETAAHASDALARQLMENGEQKLKLNFPDDHTKVYPADNQKKRKRQKEIILERPQNN